MSLSNTEVPFYYGAFRDSVLRGETVVCETISMEMNRIDEMIANPGIYYDGTKINGWIEFCENELTLTDGGDLKLLDTFKLWGEQIFGWYYFVEKNVIDEKGRIVRKNVKKRLTNKQYLIIARGAAKSVYDATIHGYYLTVDTSTTHQITTAPTMKLSEEVMSTLRTAITRSRGPFFKLLTAGSMQNTTGSKAKRQKLASTKKGIENLLTNSLLEVRPMSINKLQGLRCKIATVDEWLSGDIKEDVIGAIEQGASKMSDYLILATSSEGTVRNGAGDDIKMELLDILKGKRYDPHTSIWYYRLDDVSEVPNPEMWIKANPNLGRTVTYETYQRDLDRAENVPSARNDILAKRFGIPSEGYTYFFTYAETLVHGRLDRNRFKGMTCSMGADLSRGDDFCAFDFLFPLGEDAFGVKAQSYITERTFYKLRNAMKRKYKQFIEEGTLTVMEGTVLDMNDVYDDLIRHIDEMEYDVMCLGYDPYNATSFIENWARENGDFGIEKVIQGVKTESVPLGELKNLAEDRLLIFDEQLMSFCMGNAIVLEDTNGNRKLLKRRKDEKIDNVAAMMDAFVAYKLNKDAFE